MSDRSELMAELYRSGRTDRQIAKVFGISQSRVNQIFKKCGLTRKDGGLAVSRVEMQQQRTEKRASILAARIEKYSIPVPECGCWIWTGAEGRRGYGRLLFNKQSLSAHRVSYEVHKGPIGDGLFVCHRCDITSCVNPDHLFLGTPLENVADCWAKGRGIYGERRHNSVLNESLVRKIRASEVPTKTLARSIGVSPTTVWNVRKGITWNHVV